MDEYQKKLQEELARLRSTVQLIVDESGVEVASNDAPETVVRYLLDELHHLRSLVIRDDLTKVYNRRGFYGRSEPVFQDALRVKIQPTQRARDNVGYAIIFIDMDNFKSVNDTYGHDVGDEVLRMLARTLNASVRDSDCVGRIGGEEFVIGLLNGTEETAYVKAEQIRKAVTQNITIASDSDRVMTASIGVASLDASDADTLDELVGYADKAMYEAKTNRGKDAVVRWSELQ